MSDSISQEPTLGDAASQFLATLSTKERETSQPEVYKFALWYGWERPFTNMAAPEVAGYAERLSISDIDYMKKLGLIRSFLAYGKKMGWSQTNMATHLKTKTVVGERAQTAHGGGTGMYFGPCTLQYIHGRAGPGKGSAD